MKRDKNTILLKLSVSFLSCSVDMKRWKISSSKWICQEEPLPSFHCNFDLVNLIYPFPCLLSEIVINFFFFLLCLTSDLKHYYTLHMPYVSAQPRVREDILASLLEKNANDFAIQQEWEAEWNQYGLSSRLSEEVCWSA